MPEKFDQEPQGQREDEKEKDPGISDQEMEAINRKEAEKDPGGAELYEEYKLLSPEEKKRFGMLPGMKVEEYFRRKKESEEKTRHLREVFAEAERLYVESGKDREVGKKYLPEIYNTLIELNRLDKRVVVNPIAEWNPCGDLTEEEFNELNRRRKIFSNEIGIMTQSGTVRHDLSPDVPQSLQ
jgi:hypothetical protein